MKRLLKLTSIFLLLSFFFACSSSDDTTPEEQQQDQPEDPQDPQDPQDGALSQAAITLLSKLKENANNGNTLIGHQATTIAGVGWRLYQIPDHSDFKEVANKFPALYGWEFSYRPDNQNETYDYVSFDTTIDEAKKAYTRGGVNAFNMHPFRLDNNGSSWDATPGLVTELIPGGALHDQFKQFLDKLIMEFSKLKDANGSPIPFIFRPFHEANHNWFWWGSTACSDAEFKTLFRFTVKYMRENGLNNMLICYAPGYFETEATYLARYPGDDIVDILGFDGYYGNNNGHGTSWNVLKNHMTILKTLANSKNKPYCWAETGEKNLTTNSYFTKVHENLTEIGFTPAYLMFWANYQDNEFYVPYEELINAPLKTDFINFVQMNQYQIEGQHPNLYQ